MVKYFYNLMWLIFQSNSIKNYRSWYKLQKNRKKSVKLVNTAVKFGKIGKNCSKIGKFFASMPFSCIYQNLPHLPIFTAFTNFYHGEISILTSPVNLLSVKKFAVNLPQ
jgi:hypothetical protein